MKNRRLRVISGCLSLLFLFTMAGCSNHSSTVKHAKSANNASLTKKKSVKSGKREQEERALLNINDSFRKIIIVRNNIKKWKDDNGTLFLGLKEFLTNPDSIKS